MAEFTEEEIHEAMDHFYIGEATSSERTLHIPDDDGGTLCFVSDKDNISVVKKDASVYPVGYYRICGPCKTQYEEEVA